MNIGQKARWLGVAIVGICAFVGATSGATTRTIGAGLQTVGAGGCVQPPNAIYVMRASSSANGITHCNVYAPIQPVGTTSLSACDSTTGTSTMNLRGQIGTLSTVTFDFTGGAGNSAAPTVSWPNGTTKSTSVSNYSPVTFCVLNGQSTGLN